MVNHAAVVILHQKYCLIHFAKLSKSWCSIDFPSASSYPFNKLQEPLVLAEFPAKQEPGTFLLTVVLQLGADC